MERRKARRETFIEAGLESFGTIGYVRSTIRGICQPRIVRSPPNCLMPDLACSLSAEMKDKGDGGTDDHG